MRIREFLQSPILLWIGLVCGGCGVILMAAEAIAHLINLGIVREYLVTLIGPSLVAVGIVITLLDAYRQERLQFRSVAVLLVEVFILLLWVFSLLIKIS